MRSQRLPDAPAVGVAPKAQPWLASILPRASVSVHCDRRLPAPPFADTICSSARAGYVTGHVGIASLGKESVPAPPTRGPCAPARLGARRASEASMAPAPTTAWRTRTNWRICGRRHLISVICSGTPAARDGRVASANSTWIPRSSVHPDVQAIIGVIPAQELVVPCDDNDTGKKSRCRAVVHSRYWTGRDDTITTRSDSFLLGWGRRTWCGLEDDGAAGDAAALAP